MSKPTQGEAIVLASTMVGCDPQDVTGAVFIVAMENGTVGIGGTGQCECGVIQIISRAIERIAAGMHEGEQP